MGVRKGFNLTEHSGLLPFLGSGPSKSTAGSGFYTVEDYTAILKHAVKHYVTVLPEFDMPGHAHAAIKSMEARAQRLAGENKPTAAGQFLLSDQEDMSKYISAQLFNDNAMNPCLESTYLFVEHLIEQTVEMHKV